MHCFGLWHSAAGDYCHLGGYKNRYPTYVQVADSRGKQTVDSPYAVVRRRDGRWVLTGYDLGSHGPRDHTTGMSGGDIFICKEVPCRAVLP